jgi:hypothetical protein
MSPSKNKGVEATPLMDPEVVSKLVWDAKYLFDHGAFGPLQQAEFFKALGEQVGDPPPPPLGDLPEIKATLDLVEDADAKEL